MAGRHLLASVLKTAAFPCLLSWPLATFFQVLPVSGNLRGKSEIPEIPPTTTTNLHSPPTVSHPDAANTAALYDLLMKEKDHDSKQQKEALLDAGYPETQVELMMTMLTDPASDATYEERAKNVAAAYQRGVLRILSRWTRTKREVDREGVSSFSLLRRAGKRTGANITAIATAWATSHREDATSLQISATGRTAVDVREAELVCNQMGQASFREMEQSTATKMQQAWAKRPSCVSDGIWSCCSSAPQQLENKLAEAEEYMEELTDLVELYVREKYINKVADAAAVKNMAKAASHLMLARDLLKGML